MSSKDLYVSIKETPTKFNKTKAFLNKLKHHRHLSTKNPFLPNIISISPKKIMFKSEKKNISKKAIGRVSLFSISSTSLENMSSCDTNRKSKNNDDIELKTEKKILLDENVQEKKPKAKKRKSQSQRMIIQKSPNIINNISIEIREDNEKGNDAEELIIIRNKSQVNDTAENYLSIPKKLNEEIKKHELNVVSPNKNIEGNYSCYINGVANSLREFIELDYDSVFSKDNKDNVKYFYYTTPMDIEEDNNKKKLLLIDLDETLIHSEFRNENNYKMLDLYTKTTKCHCKTFSYSDDNFVYYIDVFFRPYLKEFLRDVSNFFDLAIFTAAMKCYADTILDYIDPKKEYFQFRLYRNACIPIQQRLYIKDLRIIKDYDPSNVILMDNSLYSFMNQPSNGMLVNSFYSNHKDTQLISARNFLINHIFPCNDVRKECEKWYHFTDLLYKGTSKEVYEE